MAKGDKKVAGYVKRYFKHQDLAAKYQAKLDALRPLKRKVDAAEVAMKIKRQTLTGGELHKATVIMQQMKSRTPAPPACNVKSCTLPATHGDEPHSWESSTWREHRT